MKTILLITILSPALLSCDNKEKTSNKTIDSTVVESMELDKATLLDNKLLGEWTVHLSCDGSIKCNVCPKIYFRSDGFGSITNGAGIVKNLKWELRRNMIKILNPDTDNIVDDGEYSMTYRTDKDIVELELINAANSDCYKFTRTISN